MIPTVDGAIIMSDLDLVVSLTKHSGPQVELPYIDIQLP